MPNRIAFGNLASLGSFHSQNKIRNFNFDLLAMPNGMASETNMPIRHGFLSPFNYILLYKI